MFSNNGRSSLRNFGTLNVRPSFQDQACPRARRHKMIRSKRAALTSRKARSKIWDLMSYETKAGPLCNSHTSCKSILPSFSCCKTKHCFGVSLIIKTESYLILSSFRSFLPHLCHHFTVFSTEILRSKLALLRVLPFIKPCGFDNCLYCTHTIVLGTDFQDLEDPRSREWK